MKNKVELVSERKSYSVDYEGVEYIVIYEYDYNLDVTNYIVMDENEVIEDDELVNDIIDLVENEN